MLYREVLEPLLYQGFPRPILLTKYTERSVNYLTLLKHRSVMLVKMYSMFQVHIRTQRVQNNPV